MMYEESIWYECHSPSGAIQVIAIWTCSKNDGLESISSHKMTLVALFGICRISINNNQTNNFDKVIYM